MVKIIVQLLHSKGVVQLQQEGDMNGACAFCAEHPRRTSESRLGECKVGRRATRGNAGRGRAAGVRDGAGELASEALRVRDVKRVKARRRLHRSARIAASGVPARSPLRHASHITRESRRFRAGFLRAVTLPCALFPSPSASHRIASLSSHLLCL